MAWDDVPFAGAHVDHDAGVGVRLGQTLQQGQDGRDGRGRGSPRLPGAGFWRGWRLPEKRIF